MPVAFIASRRLGRALVLWLVVCCGVRAQEYRFQYLGIEQGLSNLGVKNLYQDRLGFLWVSTEEGIFRYDGEHFQAFGEEDGIPASSGVAFAEAPDGDLLVGGAIGLYRFSRSRFEKLPLPGQRTVTWLGGMRSDGKGQIYVATNDGLLELTESLSTNQFDVRLIPSPASVTGSFVLGIQMDDNAVWYGCGKQICQLKNDLVRVFGAQSGLQPTRWSVIGRDMDGNLWVRGQAVGVASLAKGSSTFKMQDAPLPPTGVTGIAAVDLDRSLLFPTANGLIVRRKNEWWKIGRPEGLRGAVYAALVDREGSVWLGTAGRGLVRWAGYKTWESYTADGGLGSDVVYQMLPQPDGNLWVGTEGGLMRGTRKDGRYSWQRQPSIGAVPIHSVQAGPDGTLWLGAELGGVAHLNPGRGSVEWFNRTRGLDATSAFAVMIDHHRRIWAGTDNGLYVANQPFHRFQLVDQLPRTKFWAVAETQSGDIWAGGTAGLFHLSGSTWEKFTKKQGLSRDEVLSLGAAPNGDLWVGYRFGGEIDKVVSKNGKLSIIHAVPHQPAGGGIVYFLGFDVRNRLWAGTNHGIRVLEGDQWSNIAANDGLVWDDCDVNGFAAQPDGTVWIGTSGGLAHYTPPAHAPPPYPSSVVFTRLTLGRKNVVPADRPTVEFKSNELIAQYSDLNFTQGNALQFRYRLMPLFSEWRTTDRRELEFPGLPPGSFQLEVQVRDRSGNWSAESAVFNFEIRPPWYRTWWFLILCPVSVLMLVAGIFRLRLLVLRTREQELVRLVHLRTADLEKANEELARLSAIDGLTGIANRRTFDQFLAREWARLLRTGESLSVLLLDVDHFKLLNDTHGHQHGDLCLAQVGSQLRRVVKRRTDLVARYGGEEFAVVLPTTRAVDAMTLAEKLRQSILDLKLSNAQSPVMPFLTVSIGIGTVRKGECSSVEEFLDLIDRALYAAKKAGRNRVTFFETEERKVDGPEVARPI